jgi:hypothetical protein
VGYHCGGHVFVETNCQSSGWDFSGNVLHGECDYDSDGTCRRVGDLILPDNPLCGGCAGNADRFNSVGDGVLSKAGHFFLDEGGPNMDNPLHIQASMWHLGHPNEPPPPDMGKGFWFDLLSHFGD